MVLDRPKCKVSFRYTFSNHFKNDVKWRVRVFIDDLNCGCIWCTEINEYTKHLGISFIDADKLQVAEFYLLDYELIEDK